MNFQDIVASASPEVYTNENFETIDYASVYGKRQPVTSGLTWGYYGGRWNGIAITAGTIALTNNIENYISVNRSTGAIGKEATTGSPSVAPTNWNNLRDYARVYKLWVSGGVVTAVEDYRAGNGGIFGPAGFTSTRVPFAASDGSLTDDSGFTFNTTGDILTVGAINVAGTTAPTVGWYNPSGSILRSPNSVTVDGSLTAGTTGSAHVLTGTAGGNIFAVKAASSGDALLSFGLAAGSGAGLSALNNALSDFEPIAITGESVSLKYRTGVGTSTEGLGISSAGAVTIPVTLDVTGNITTTNGAGSFRGSGAAVNLILRDTDNYSANTSGAKLFMQGKDDTAANVNLATIEARAIGTDSGYLLLRARLGGGTSDVLQIGNGTAATIFPKGLVDISAAAAGQIKFPATQNASADANTLDDYEEGTWTAAFVAGTSGTITISTATGRYIKVGGNVTISGLFDAASVSSPVGILTITGLPFTSASYYTGVAVHAELMEATATTAVQGFIATASTAIRLSKFAAGAASNLAADVKATTAFIVNSTYSIV